MQKEILTAPGEFSTGTRIGLEKSANLRNEDLKPRRKRRNGLHILNTSNDNTAAATIATDTTASNTTASDTNTASSPKTGDDTPIAWLFVLLLGSAAGLFAVNGRKKGGKNQ